MNTELLKSIQDRIAPIRQQLEANQKAMVQQVLDASNRGGLTGAQLQSLTGLTSTSTATAGASALDPDQMRQDMQLRTLFSRIKYANVSRAQRDSLSNMVRYLAADDRLDDKSTTSIYKMVALEEAMGGTKRETATFGFGNSERSVDDEMKYTHDQKAAKIAQYDSIQELQSTFSISA